MKKYLALFVVLGLLMSFAACAAEEVPPVRVASLKGPTSMGLAGLMLDEAASKAYSFTVAGTADEIVPLIAKGEIDIAMIPANLASVLYNKTKGAVQALAINTLGVLYIVETGDTVRSLEDLKGKTLYSTGKGTTPEYALNAVMRAAGIDPEKDLTIEYKSESTEIAAALEAGQATLALLPQPYVTAVSGKLPALRTALSLTEEWERVMTDGSSLVTGVAIARKAFAEENPEALSAFLNDYAASVEFVNGNPAEAAVKIEEIGVAKAAVAEKAIPLCNIVFIEGEKMRAALSGYLGALYAQDPAAVGGEMPHDDFYRAEA